MIKSDLLSLADWLLEFRLTRQEARLFNKAGLLFLRVGLSRLHARNLKSLPLLASEELRGLIVADDLLGLRIPLDDSAKSRGDRGEMACIHHLHVAEDVRHRQATFFDTTVEIVLVTFELLPFVEFEQVSIGELPFVPLLVDRLAGDLAAVHEHAAFGTFKEDAVISSAGDVHLDAAREFALHREVVRRVVAVVDRGVAVFVFDGMLGVGAVNFDWSHACFVMTDRPCCDVDMVRTPVGELAAGVFVPPTELVVTAFVDVTHDRSLAEPHVPIELLRRFTLRERSADVTTVNANGDFLNVAEQTFLDHVDRSQEETFVASLLCADDEDAVGVFFAGIPNQLVLFERERERFLAEHMLACLQRFDGNLHVPVIWRNDANDVDVISLENLAVVGVRVGLTLAELVVVLGSFCMPRINIADSENVTKPRVSMSVSGPHASDADAADSWAIILFLISERFLRPREVRQSTGCGDGRRCLQKITSRGCVVFLRHQIIPFWRVLLNAGERLA